MQQSLFLNEALYTSAMSPDDRRLYYSYQSCLSSTQEQLKHLGVNHANFQKMLSDALTYKFAPPTLKAILTNPNDPAHLAPPVGYADSVWLNQKNQELAQKLRLAKASLDALTQEYETFEAQKMALILAGDQDTKRKHQALQERIRAAAHSMGELAYTQYNYIIAFKPLPLEEYYAKVTPLITDLLHFHEEINKMRVQAVERRKNASAILDAIDACQPNATAAYNLAGAMEPSQGAACAFNGAQGPAYPLTEALDPSVYPLYTSDPLPNPPPRDSDGSPSY